jgi:hypothetical protein
MSILKLELEKCVNPDGIRCPFVEEKLTKGYGYAVDYMCGKCDNRVTSVYVEWDSDVNPVPNWCPLKWD